MKPNKHDDMCPCTRFRAQDEFCTCGAVERAEIVADASKNFAEHLRRINSATDAEISEAMAEIHRKQSKVNTLRPARPSAQTHLMGINTDLLKALKYARRFLTPEDHDVSYVDDVIDKAEGRGLYAATTEGKNNG